MWPGERFPRSHDSLIELIICTRIRNHIWRADGMATLQDWSWEKQDRFKDVRCMVVKCDSSDDEGQAAPLPAGWYTLHLKSRWGSSSFGTSKRSWSVKTIIENVVTKAGSMTARTPRQWHLTSLVPSDHYSDMDRHSIPTPSCDIRLMTNKLWQSCNWSARKPYRHVPYPCWVTIPNIHF
jgi:hypothetical protein